MLDILLVEVGAPVLDQLLAQVVSLVDEEDELFVALTNLLNVLLQIFTVEEVGVPGVDDLQQQIALLDNAPKLSPDVHIFLKRCDSQRDVVLLNVSDVATPLKERHVLLSLDLMAGHAPVPGGSSGDGQWHVLARDLLVFVA
eukprot:CAMPEP_0185592482 /NCGR_PEP_ID=MMETSP0434-20130131/68060_1 /TAXON_ID=626734 ORGANISM="Favella taraikaensis, Strain Fe Narragansett Bay" /NCGR_SAMPLE_ID=MMETSP0434 /ASSEMBLY_ACC=CAM_ASM_000379 /LENGTH=141 /DNA_ID=CAMNT_0028218309 /DNA_START=1516 /DNA_END=1941 /DNA_ORIENTATION=-